MKSLISCQLLHLHELHELHELPLQFQLPLAFPGHVSLSIRRLIYSRFNLMAGECQADKYKCFAALSAHGHMLRVQLGGLGQAVHQAGWSSSVSESTPTQDMDVDVDVDIGGLHRVGSNTHCCCLFTISHSPFTIFKLFHFRAMY